MQAILSPVKRNRDVVRVSYGTQRPGPHSLTLYIGAHRYACNDSAQRGPRRNRRSAHFRQFGPDRARTAAADRARELYEAVKANGGSARETTEAFKRYAEASVEALQAQALAPHVRVCGVAPGLMFLSGPQAQANFDRASRVNLMRRPIDPADVARTCLFLAQTRSITGSTVSVDNGQHLVPLERDVMFVVDELMKATP